jgi:hypothetical protein
MWKICIAAVFVIVDTQNVTMSTRTIRHVSMQLMFNVWATACASSVTSTLIMEAWTSELLTAYLTLSERNGRAMSQVVSRWPVTAEAQVFARVNPCGICGGQSCTGTAFSPSSSVSPCQYIIPPSLSKLISSGECVIY